MAVIKKNNNFFFPASNIRRYYYPSMTSTYGAQGFITLTNNINYFPIFISKYIINPNFCIECTTGTGTVQVGIYDGKNGFENAPLLWSGNIVVTGSNYGIIKTTSNIRLKEGWYVLGSVITSISGTLTCRTSAVNYYRVLFGERIDISIGGGLASSQYTQISATLPQNIGSGASIIIVGSATAPIIALEY